VLKDAREGVLGELGEEITATDNPSYRRALRNRQSNPRFVAAKLSE